jgi:hypothetical protein
MPTSYQRKAALPIEKRMSKALLNNEMTTVRIGAKVNSFVSTVLQHPRQGKATKQNNENVNEEFVDKTNLLQYHHTD